MERVRGRLDAGQHPLAARRTWPHSSPSHPLRSTRDRRTIRSADQPAVLATARGAPHRTAPGEGTQTAGDRRRRYDLIIVGAGPAGSAAALGGAAGRSPGPGGAGRCRELSAGQGVRRRNRAAGIARTRGAGGARRRRAASCRSAGCGCAARSGARWSPSRGRPRTASRARCSTPGSSRLPTARGADPASSAGSAP